MHIYYCLFYLWPKSNGFWAVYKNIKQNINMAKNIESDGRLQLKRCNKQQNLQNRDLRQIINIVPRSATKARFSSFPDL